MPFERRRPKNSVKYIIIAKKKGKNQKVEEYTAYNEDAKDRIVENLKIDNYKVKVMEKTTGTERLLNSLFKQVEKL